MKLYIVYSKKGTLSSVPCSDYYLSQPIFWQIFGTFPRFFCAVLSHNSMNVMFHLMVGSYMQRLNQNKSTHRHHSKVGDWTYQNALEIAGHKKGVPSHPSISSRCIIVYRIRSRTSHPVYHLHPDLP